MRAFIRVILEMNLSNGNYYFGKKHEKYGLLLHHAIMQTFLVSIIFKYKTVPNIPNITNF